MNEVSKDRSLDRIHKWAQVFALIGMPVVVAVVGWAAQASVAEASSRKDYLQMSLQTLREPRRPDDSDVRSWATQIIANYSPIPFTAKAGDQLSSSLVSMLNSNPMLAGAMMSRPRCPIINVETLPSDQRPVVEDLQRLCTRNATELMWLQIYLGMIKEPTTVPSMTAPIGPR